MQPRTDRTRYLLSQVPSLLTPRFRIRRFRKRLNLILSVLVIGSMLMMPLQHDSFSWLADVIERIIPSSGSAFAQSPTGYNACGLYPIALSTQSLQGLSVGDSIGDIYNGEQPGSFGWLTWTGEQSAVNLATSLTPPGNVDTYTNPFNANDHTVSAGDWVQSDAGVSNSNNVRAALNQLMSLDITVPVWDAVSGTGSTAKYHVGSFARVRITSYDLPGVNRITARFLGYTVCGNRVPTSTVTRTPTNTPTPTNTRTPSATWTMFPSPTDSPTNTATKSPTRTYTATRANTNTPTATPTQQVFQFQGLNVSVGYADSLRGNPNFPVPWDGAPNIMYIGIRNNYIDGGAIRLDNPSDQAVTVQNVTVRLPNHIGTQLYNLWGSFTIPPHISMILTQTGTSENFDTSDYGIPGHGCGQYAGPNEFPPEIAITLGNGQSGTLYDRGHILDTGGFDSVCLGNESHGWQAIGILGGSQQATVFLSPLNQPAQTTTSATITANVTDASNLPLANVAVDFSVISGPNTGRTGQVTTDAQGQATFSYIGNAVGTDTVRASVTNAVGGIIYSNNVTVVWQSAPLPTNTPTRTNTPTATPTTPGQPTATNTPGPPETVVQGWIGSPASGSAVSDTVPITLGSGITLTQGQVSYYPLSDPGNVTVLNNNATGGPGSTVATLDTTLLADESYIVLLTGTNDNNEQLTSAIILTVVGENKPGRVTFTVTDLVVPLTGLPISIGRTYDSLERGHIGDFGYGWKLSIGNPRLETNLLHDVTLTLPGGRRTTFFFQPRSFGFPFNFLLQPNYTPEPGTHGTLAGDGCGVLINSSSGVICFLDVNPYSPTTYVYTDPAGQEYTMDANGTLRSIRDRTGNVLTYTPNGIVSSIGNVNVPFVRDGQGRITQITDPNGKIYRYNYSAAGDLTGVVLPSETNPIGYTYDPSHLITSGVDPRGNTSATTEYFPNGRLKSVTDGLGNTTQFTYDTAANITRMTNPDGGVVVSHYDGYGLLLSETDPLNRTTSFQYDANRNPIRVTDPMGRVTQFTYDGQGNQTSITDPLNNARQIVYDSRSNPVSMTDPVGNVQTVTTDYNNLPAGLADSLGSLGGYVWDSKGNPLTRYDAMGRETTFTYDQYGNKISETDPLGHSTSFTYDDMGRMLTATDPLGNTTTYVYDELGRTQTMTDPLGNVSRYEYDFNGNRTADVDAAGRRTQYTYDVSNRLTRITYADGTTQNYTYDFRNNLLTETDQSGRVITYVYDRAGQLVSATYASGTADESTTRYGYDGAGRKTSETDGLGHVTQYQYDAAGRLTRVTDALGNATQYEYDAASRKTADVDPSGHRTTYTYDARSRMVRTSYADGTSKQWGYDLNGNVVSTTDQAGKVTSFGYDDARRLTLVINPLNQWTQYSWDAAGQLQTVTDANGRQTGFAYDGLYRLTRKTLPDGTFETQGYDTVSNRTSYRMTDGQTNTYQYNNMNRMTRINYFDGQSVQFTYTPTGNRATAVDSRGTAQYQYDNQDRLVRVTQPGGQAVSYTYDAIGKRLTLTTPAGTVGYSYDNANRLTQVTDPQGRATGYTYDASGLRTRLSLPNGIQVNYTYDALNRMTGLTQQRTSQQPFASYAYTLDPVGNRTKVTELDGSSTQWGYDNADRLTGETTRNPANTITSQASYSYDPVGNRASMTKNGQSTVYSYNALDQLVSAGGAQYTYDGRGNLTTMRDGGSTSTFGYDAANRMTSASGPAGSATFAYDADGRRVRQTAGGVVTNYLWDEQTALGDVVLETNGAGATVASYVMGGCGSGQCASCNASSTCGNGSELISQTRGGSVSFYLHDGQQSVRALADLSGNITDRYTYDAFGALLNQQGTNLNPYRYTDQQYDAVTGLYSLRARYYSPTTGRFQSRDLVDAPLTDPTEMNRYEYARNNPINFFDPSGLSAGAIAAPRPVAGGAAGEYAMLIALIAIPAIPALIALGRAIECVFIKAATFLMGAAGLPTSWLNYRIECQFPVCEFPLVGMPTVFLHMGIAMYLKGKPRLLTYDSDKSRQRMRRAQACGGVVRKMPMSCDEYPFASSFEGGTGASTMVVPFTENSAQGRAMARCVSRFKMTTGTKYWVVLNPLSF